MCAVLHGERPKFPPDSGKCSHFWEHTIERAWHAEPSERPAAQEFLAQIRQELHPLGDEGDEDLHRRKEHGDAVQERDITARRSCEVVEDIGVVDVRESVDCGSVTCLTAAKHVFKDTSSKKSTHPKKVTRTAVVGGTSRGFLLCWSAPVEKKFLLIDVLTPDTSNKLNKQGECVAQLQAHEDNKKVNCLLAVHAHNAIWSGSSDRTIHIWRPHERKKVRDILSCFAISLSLTQQPFSATSLLLKGSPDTKQRCCVWRCGVIWWLALPQTRR